ncbi:MAG: twin-arginine translocation signal domain-containing protein, partial [Phycisphaerae bacterium]
MSDLMNRREFLGASAAGVALLAGRLSSRAILAVETSEWPSKLGTVKIRKVYL